MRDRIESIDSQRRVAYIGIPGDTVYRYCSENDPPNGVVLDPRTDIAGDLSTRGDNDERVDDDASFSRLSIAILADFLEDTARVARLSGAFSWRIRVLVPAGRRWIVTETEVAAAIKAAELDSKLTWDDRKGRYQDEPDEDFVAHKTFRKQIKEQAAKSAA